MLNLMALGLYTLYDDKGYNCQALKDFIKHFLFLQWHPTYILTHVNPQLSINIILTHVSLA